MIKSDSPSKKDPAIDPILIKRMFNSFSRKVAQKISLFLTLLQQSLHP
jgi:hypothetical protein